MKFQIKLIILILFALSASTAGVQPEVGYYTSQCSDIPKRLLAGSQYSLHDPVNRQIIMGSAIFSLTGLYWDQSISNRVRAEQPLSELLNRFGDEYGNWSGYALLSVISLKLLVNPDSRLLNCRRFEYASLVLLSTSAMTGFIKIAMGRERPNKQNRRSFPSGHCSHSLVVATIIGDIYGSIPGRIAYTCAGDEDNLSTKFF